MKKAIALAAAPLLLVSLPQPATAKPAIVVVQPEGSQTAMMENGSQIITSELPGSTVVMRTPAPFEDGRTVVFFTFVNKGSVPVNVGPENVTSAQIAVVSYDKLMAEQKNREGWRKFGEALAAVGNSLSASDAGRQSTVTSYSGYADCGFGCGGTYTGSAVSSTYSPYAAQQARLQADAQNRAAAAAMHADHAAARSAIGANLRTTTVLPGHFITGMLTFEVPRAVTVFEYALPTSIQSNVTPPAIQSGKETLYFLPDFLLVVHGSKVGAVAYDELSITWQDTPFIEEEEPPSDTTIIDYVWKYPNKSGGPDRRFRDNRQLPVCLYESFHLKSGNGLNELLQVSTTGCAGPFSDALKGLVSANGSAANTETLPMLTS